VNVDVAPAPPEPAAASGGGPEALIKEARRRQRRRQLLLCGAAVILMAGVLGVVTAQRGASHPQAAMPPAHHRTPRSGSDHVAPAPVPGPIPASVDSTVLMWPVGPEQDGTIYLDNLRTGHLGFATPVVDPGEYQPIMLVDGKIIYVVSRGVLATDAATGRTRVLGHTVYFAPSGQPGHIWLMSDVLGLREVVRLVPVDAGRPGSPITLPRGTQLIAGTDAGLLLAAGDALELWNPGSSARTLPHSKSAQGYTVSPRLVAYDTGCANPETSPDLSYDGGFSYYACRTLRVFNVVTGKLLSFAAPPGTDGWVPGRGFNWSLGAISPSGTLMAAKAVFPPEGQGVTREFVLRLSGRGRRVTAVPSSAAFLLAATTWSAGSSWLFYQGPGARLWAYQPSTGDVRSSRTHCCQYATMATLSGRSR
jgi:hypothetical protein